MERRTKHKAPRVIYMTSHFRGRWHSEGMTERAIYVVHFRKHRPPWRRGNKKGDRVPRRGTARNIALVKYGSSEPFYPWPAACPFSKGRQLLAVKVHFRTFSPLRTFSTPTSNLRTLSILRTFSNLSVRLAENAE